MQIGKLSSAWMMALLLLLPGPALGDTRSELQDFMTNYGWLIDQRDAKAVGQLFEQGGRLEIPAVDGTFTGPEEIADFFTGVWKPLDDAKEQRRHVITNLRVLQEDRDRASLRTYVTIFGSTPGTPPGLRMVGFYEAMVVRSGGQWRFEALRINIDNPPQN